ncbi:MAG: penicillin-binding protein 2 [Candidatus Limnocylindrales bacterium]|jgi:penicillin-binding protein 2
MSVRLPEQLAAPRNLYRFGTFVLAIVVAITALGVQMFYLQLVQQPQTYQISSGQSTVTEPVPSSRGLIYDANGTPLVQNIPDYEVEVIPQDLPLSEKPVVVRRLASLLNMDTVTIDQAIDSATGSLFNPVVVASGVDTNVARLIDENSDVLPGVQVVAVQDRDYTYGPLFGELLGYTGLIDTEQYADLKAAGYSPEDTIGQAGLEQYYESTLRGTYGTQTVALDANGQPITGLVTAGKAPVPGSSLTLSINVHEQQIALRALQWGLTEAHVKMGTIIVENPQNGDILAMVSLPGYDDNTVSQNYQTLVSDPNMPLVNKAVSDQYAPGSTYKLVAGTAGLQTGVITATTLIDSQPYIMIGNEKFWEWNKTGWGPLNIIMGLAHSSDTFFYQLSEKVGLTQLTYWAREYGFGAKTGIDLPGEATGIVPDDTWKEIAMGEPMYEGEIAQAGIGQGYDAVTPIQLLNAYCALINGGNLWTPHLVTSITDPDGTVHAVAPQLIRKLPASAQTLETIRLGTRAVVTSRHTYNLVDLPIVVAGKTGTAEFGERDKYGRLPYHEWFVGYTPGDPYHGSVTGTDSQLAVLVFAYGADTWGDISTEIVKYYMWLHYGLKGSATNSANPGHINMWAFKTTNFYGTANNH